jgi:hypothetical protein
MRKQMSSVRLFTPHATRGRRLPWSRLGGVLLVWLASMLVAQAATMAYKAQPSPTGPQPNSPAPAPIGATPACAGDFLSLEEALELAFPGTSRSTSTTYLSAPQRAAIEARLGAPLDHGIARCYVARTPSGEVLGYAWVDTHRVRSKKETLLVSVDVQGRLLGIEVLAFAEPKDYVPRAAFYEQFAGQRLDQELDFGRGIGSVAGATLTARATLGAARRALCLQAELFPPPPRGSGWAFPARFAGAALLRSPGASAAQPVPAAVAKHSRPPAR